MSNNCGEFLITRFPFSSPCLIRRGLPRTAPLNWFSCFVLVPSNAPGMALGAVSTHLHFSCEFGVGSSKLGERSPDLAFLSASLPDPAQAAASAVLLERFVPNCEAHLQL